MRVNCWLRERYMRVVGRSSRGSLLHRAVRTYDSSQVSPTDDYISNRVRRHL